MTRWWGRGTALLIAALLPAACTEKVVLEHPVGGSGGGAGASGIGGASGGNDGGSSDASTDRSGRCPGGGGNTLAFEQESPQIMIALDRSPSMADPLVLGQQGQQHTKFALTANAIENILSTPVYTSVVQFGYVEFPGSSNDPSCNNGCCATGLVQPVPQGGSFNQVFSELGSCVGPGQVSCSGAQSAPTDQALVKIANTFKHVTGSLYAVILTDGPPSPNCPFDPTNSTDTACEQTSNQIFAMREGSPSISTFVMVIGTPTIDDPNNPAAGNTCLSIMANNGGHVRNGSPSPTYIQSLTESSVDANLTAIVRSTICRVDITEPGFDPNVDADGVEVDYNSVPVTRDPPNQPSNGWSFDTSVNARSTIILNGALCDNVINNKGTRRLSVKGCIRSWTPFPSPPP